MRILALDQASRTTGYSIFEDGKLIDYGHFTVSDSDLGVRLMKIRDKLIVMLGQGFDKVYFEDIQLQDDVQNNVETFKTLAEVYGVIYETLTEYKIPHQSVLAVSWKVAVGIDGKKRPEQKKNAQKFVKEYYGVNATEDESDAICIGAWATGYRTPAKAKAKTTKKVESGFDWSD